MPDVKPLRLSEEIDRLVAAFAKRPVQLRALLLLPLPIPFSNTLPALTVVLLAAAMLERDGYFVVAGLVMFAATLGYFGSLVFGGTAIVRWLHQ
jgi:hypothetical protein